MEPDTIPSLDFAALQAGGMFEGRMALSRSEKVIQLSFEPHQDAKPRHCRIVASGEIFSDAWNVLADGLTT
jgi:hypothetical protein